MGVEGNKKPMLDQDGLHTRNLPSYSFAVNVLLLGSRLVSGTQILCFFLSIAVVAIIRIVMIGFIERTYSSLLPRGAILESSLLGSFRQLSSSYAGVSDAEH